MLIKPAWVFVFLLLVLITDNENVVCVLIVPVKDGFIPNIVCEVALRICVK